MLVIEHLEMQALMVVTSHNINKNILIQPLQYFQDSIFLLRVLDVFCLLLNRHLCIRRNPPDWQGFLLVFQIVVWK